MRISLGLSAANKDAPGSSPISKAEANSERREIWVMTSSCMSPAHPPGSMVPAAAPHGLGALSCFLQVALYFSINTLYRHGQRKVTHAYLQNERIYFHGYLFASTPSAAGIVTGGSNRIPLFLK